jgi:ABC-2 type transport system permease protein/lipopolysaccharide transport system permease protein
MTLTSKVDRTARSEFGFETGGRPTTRMALADIVQALAQWELWLTMAWQDIRLGFLAWLWMANTANESTLLFVTAQRYVKQVRLPITLFVFRLVARNLIVLAHNFLVYIAVILLVGLRPGWVALLAIPGLLLSIICMFWISLLFGMLGARFRDFPQIITSLVQVVFYVTPIMWEPDQLGSRRYSIVDYNPVYYFIEIVRAPLLGHMPPVGYWKLSFLITLGVTLIVFPIFRRFRGRVAYWV